MSKGTVTKARADEHHRATAHRLEWKSLGLGARPGTASPSPSSRALPPRGPSWLWLRLGLARLREGEGVRVPRVIAFDLQVELDAASHWTDTSAMQPRIPSHSSAFHCGEPWSHETEPGYEPCQVAVGLGLLVSANNGEWVPADAFWRRARRYCSLCGMLLDDRGHHCPPAVVHDARQDLPTRRPVTGEGGEK